MSDMLKEMTPISGHEYGSPVGTGFIKDCSGKLIVTSVKDVRHVRAIVTAVNAYEPMLAALEDALSIIEGHSVLLDCLGSPDSFASIVDDRDGKERLNAIRAAIAQAKGEAQ